MATATYDKIATQTLASAASSITFSSIAASWTDLRLVLVSTTATASQGVLCRFNSDTATNYSQTNLYGSGSAAGSAKGTGVAYIDFDAATGGNDTDYPTLYRFDVFSYAGSTYKTGLLMNNGDRNSYGYVVSEVTLWRSTAAITTILLYPSVGNFKINTTATLYGIKSA